MTQYVRAYTTWNAIKYTGDNVADVRQAVAHLCKVWEQDGAVYLVGDNRTIVGQLHPDYSPWVLYVAPDATGSTSGPFVEEGAEPLYIAGPNYADPDAPPAHAWMPAP